MPVVVVGGIAFLAFAFLLERCSGPSSTEPKVDNAPSQTSAVSVPTPAPEAPKPVENWSYWDDEDSMSGKRERGAAIESTNTLNFDFPYSGEQRVRLALRRHPRWGNDVMLKIEKGQILCHTYECPVRVRFDDEPPRTYSGNEPSDNSSETVFIPAYKTFDQKLRTAKRVRIEFNVFHEGTQVAEFEVAGYDPKRLN